MSKKKFKDTTVGQLLFGAASVINPTLGSVLQGVTSPKEAIAAIEATAISPTDLFATVEEKTEAVTSQVDLADGCNTDFSPNLVSLVSMYMSAITNPTGAVLSGLQLLNNTLDIKPPGFGLPEIDLDLGLPNISLPSLDFDISLGGGFDVNSMLKGAANLFAICNKSTCARTNSLNRIN